MRRPQYPRRCQHLSIKGEAVLQHPVRHAASVRLWRQKIGTYDQAEALSFVYDSSLDEELDAWIKRMVETQPTAFPELSRTPWTPRRERRIWRGKRIKAAHNSTGCSEWWSKKLRQPCDGGYCWKEQPINWRIPECRSRRSPWTQTTVRWRRSLALSERLFGFLPASTVGCVIRTFTCRRPTEFTFLPLVPQQKEEVRWIYSIVLQATTHGTHGVCWNTRVL